MSGAARPAGNPRPSAAKSPTFLAAGGLEVTLLGQNVNSYGRGLTEPISFAGLLRRLQELPGLRRLRFATSHPRDLSDDLLAAYGELPALCEHLHLPVQSGSNRILQGMNRRLQPGSVSGKGGPAAASLPRHRHLF